MNSDNLSIRSYKKTEEIKKKGGGGWTIVVLVPAPSMGMDNTAPSIGMDSTGHNGPKKNITTQTYVKLY